MKNPAPVPLRANRFADMRIDQLNREERDTLVRLAIESLEIEFWRPRELLSKPSQVQTWLRLRLSGCRDEIFGMLFLNTRHYLIEKADLFRGTVDGASVHPRVVVRRALELNAAAAIAYHNHPSGTPDPSAADRHITQRLKSALALVDVRLLDHIVVSASGSVSMAEQGLM